MIALNDPLALVDRHADDPDTLEIITPESLIFAIHAIVADANAVHNIGYPIISDSYSGEGIEAQFGKDCPRLTLIVMNRVLDREISADAFIKHLTTYMGHSVTKEQIWEAMKVITQAALIPMWKACIDDIEHNFKNHHLHPNNLEGSHKVTVTLNESTIVVTHERTFVVTYVEGVYEGHHSHYFKVMQQMSITKSPARRTMEIQGTRHAIDLQLPPNSQNNWFAFDWFSMFR